MNLAVAFFLVPATKNRAEVLPSLHVHVHTLTAICFFCCSIVALPIFRVMAEERNVLVSCRMTRFRCKSEQQGIAIKVSNEVLKGTKATVVTMKKKRNNLAEQVGRMKIFLRQLPYYVFAQTADSYLSSAASCNGSCERDATSLLAICLYLSLRHT